MSYGDGGIYPAKDSNGKTIQGKWTIRLYFGKDAHGKQKRITRVVNGNKKKAQKVRDELRRQYSTGQLDIDAQRMTFAEMVEQWNEYRISSEKVSEENLITERSMLAYACLFIGNMKLSDIKPYHIEAMYNEIKEGHLKDNRKRCSTTMQKYHIKIKSVFAKAVSYDYILRNPCDVVDTPRKRKPNRKSLSAHEMALLIQQLDESEEITLKEFSEKEQRQAEWFAERNYSDERTSIAGLNTLSYLMAVRLACSTGMRRSEVFGLSWDDVSLNMGKLTVNKVLTSSNNLKHKTKTHAGQRDIALDEVTLLKLKSWKQYQAEILESLGIQQSANTPVCCSRTGSWVWTDNFERWWRKWKAENGFPNLLFHELRHSQATLLFAQGIDAKTIQTRMGHSSAAFTLDTYAHAVPENDVVAASLIGAVLDGKKGQVKQFKSA